MQAGVDGLVMDKTRPAGARAGSGGDRGRGVAPDPAAAAARGHPLDGTGHGRSHGAGGEDGASDLGSRSGQRIWKAHSLTPHRWRQFKLSNDAAFAEKLTDIVGLYVSPPAHAVVLSLDEKSQIQALDRTKSGLPMKPGRCGTMTHDYKRHGTTTLFAALNVLTGEVFGRNMQRHRHQEFIRFLNAIERDVPPGKIIHAILDKLCSPQDARGATLAGAPSPLHLPLHAHFQFLAERRGRLLCQTDPSPPETGRLPVRR